MQVRRNMWDSGKNAYETFMLTRHRFVNSPPPFTDEQVSRQVTRRGLFSPHPTFGGPRLHGLLFAQNQPYAADRVLPLQDARKRFGGGQYHTLVYCKAFEDERETLVRRIGTCDPRDLVRRMPEFPRRR